MQLPADSHLACHDCDALFSAAARRGGRARLLPPLRRHPLLPPPQHRPPRHRVRARLGGVLHRGQPIPVLDPQGRLPRERHDPRPERVGLENFGYTFLAAAVGVFTLAAPTLIIGGLLYLLIPLLSDRRLPGAMHLLPRRPRSPPLEHGRGVPARRARQPAQTRQARHTDARHLFLGLRRPDRHPDRRRLRHRLPRTLGPPGSRATFLGRSPRLPSGPDHSPP